MASVLEIDDEPNIVILIWRNLEFSHNSVFSSEADVGSLCNLQGLTGYLISSFSRASSFAGRFSSPSSFQWL
jgi:hypothetical protein